jgi:peptidoglycan/LPS O-acetylase OafA/YrhL
MRAIAISSVIFGHVYYDKLQRAWTVAHFGVTSFFVISGFLITLLLIREREREGDISIVRFYQRRALRILPAYVVLLGAVAVLQFAGVYTISLSSWLRVLTYTSCFSLSTVAPVLGHTWSLSVEEHFYFLWPVLFKYCRPRTAVAILVAYIAAAPFLRWYMLRAAIPWLDIFASPSQMASIAVGCVLAFVVASERMIPPPFAVGLGIALLIPSLFLGAHPDLRTVLDDSLRSGGAGLVMIGILTTRQTGLVSRVLNSRPLTWIGVLSYSLYLWQQPLTFAKAAAWWDLPVLLAVALASYHFVERPFLALKESFVRKTAGRPGGTVVQRSTS